MPPPLERFIERLRADFRFSIISVFGSVAAFAIAPFALFRFAQGDWAAGIVDSLIVLGIAGPAFYAWRGGNLERAGLGIATTSTVGALLIVALLDQTGVLWLFPTLLANFFLVRPRIAGSFALAAIALVQLQPDAFTGPAQRLTVSVTLLLVALFAMVFALRSNMQRRELENIASIDPLTGTRNRRAMEAEVEIALKSHHRSGRPITLMLLDLDHFKRVNDRYGHEEGDRVLCVFVALLGRATRATDRLFRFGGEEFVLLMEHTDEIAAARAFANLRRQLHDGLRADGEPVTVSAGAAVLRHGESRDAWFARADAALYRAKQEGRDRIVIDGPKDA